MIRILLFISLLLPGLAHATTFYVDSTAGACTGNYSIASRNCTGADGNSYASIANGIAALTNNQADTLYIRTGTYLEQINMTSKHGSSGNIMTVAGYPGETAPTIRPSSGQQVVRDDVYSYITFKHLILDGVNATSALPRYWEIWPGSTNVTVDDVEVVNVFGNGLLIGSSGSGPSNVTIKNSSFHDNRGTDAGGTRYYGMYVDSGTNIVIERNKIYNNVGGGMQVYPGPLSGVVIRYNQIYNNNVYTTSSVGGILIGTGATGTQSGTQIYGNLIYGNGTTGPASSASGIWLYNGPSGTQIFNNVIYNNKNYGVQIGSGGTASVPTNTTVQNNIIIANPSGQVGQIAGTGNTISYNACAAGDSCGTTGKVSIAAITTCTSSTSDFTQKSTSTCINTGTNVGLPYNGSAPDIGAFETFVFAVCSVENATASVINTTFTNNAFPPLLPSTGVTTFTARKATVNDVVTGVVRTGDNQLDITVTNAFVAGNAIDISWASGNLTDSALIGGSLNQPYVQGLTNQSCTNNVGASPSHLFIQAKFEFHGLRGTEAAPVVMPYSAAAENTNINVVAGGKARLRLALTCSTADCPPTGFYLYYSKNGGAYAVVPDSFGADNIAFCGTASDSDIPASGTATTDQLSTAGTFVAAALVRTSNAIPTIDLAQDNKTEPEYCVAWDTDTTADTTYDFRIYKQDATAIDTYTVTPRATVRAMSAGLGF